MPLKGKPEHAFQTFTPTLAITSEGPLDLDPPHKVQNGYAMYTITSTFAAIIQGKL